MVPWLDVFEPLAYKLHVVVTIEDDRRIPTTRTPIFDVRYVTPPSTQPTTPDELMKLIAAWFPTADITAERDSVGLVHLSDSSLRDVSKGRNLLNSTVTINLQGPAKILMPKLQELSKGTITLDGPTAKRVFNAGGFQISMAVNVADQSYRTFLDEGVVSSSNERVLWEADILNLNGMPAVAVKVPQSVRGTGARPRIPSSQPATRPALKRMPPASMPAGQPAGTADGAPLPRMLFWADAIEPLARSFDVYYYIENDHRGGETPQFAVDSRYVTPPQRNGDVPNQVNQAIDRWFPGITLARDMRYPNVYCLQPKLPQDTDHVGNPLDAPCTLQFDGSMQDLMKQIEVSTNGAIVMDKQSSKKAGLLNGGRPVHIFLLEQTYRDVFFQALQHPDGNHVMWQADIQSINGKPTAVMKFFGNSQPAGH